MKKTYYENHKKLEKCVCCGKKLIDKTFIKCITCRNKTNQRRKNNIDSGKCVVCSSPLPSGRKNKTCPICYKRISDRAKKFGRDNKLKLLELAGRVCSVCGLNTDILDVYDFHHKNPDEKEIPISLLLRYKVNTERIKKEVSKCILVCSNCHRTIHYNLRNKNVNL